MTALTRVRRGLVALLVVPALLLSGCGGSDGDGAEPTTEPSADQPTVDIDVPEGVTLTDAGTKLALREQAVVAYESNPQRGTVLSLSVDSIQAVRLADFAAYQLDDRTKKSRPYFVRVTIKNLGPGDLSRVGVPIYAVDQNDTLIQQSTFNTSFAKCPSLPLPAGFTAGRSTTSCLVYFVPNAGTLTKMSYRPLQAFAAITWEGTILPPATQKKDQKKDQKKKAKKQAKP